ncbi:MAG: Protein of unknown function DUF1549/DUF1553/Planctomycete cytochrome C [Verrucomicrobia bacterium]|nr:MAG: Protein of unknown function DUF1549/DUF1553/Planctomycete cytochrome C [Verrucomicrobiota bacterium]
MTASLAGERPPDFTRDILPILSDNCFQCHGPDAKKGRKGDLRLDDETDAKRERQEGRHVIAAGSPDSSELWRRLVTNDPEERMPPAKLSRELSPIQRDLIRRWITAGARWGKHWAFEPVTRPEISAGGGHPIDTLIARRLATEGIHPTPLASPETLIRRLSLDLTGLPPSPAETAEFLADKAPGAWERLVDRTLQKPSFGERMSWDWLESARYADSNGYQGDNERTMWPWRDWVVKAFNENLPYDQFTIWQLAGDLLPNPTRDQVLATAFNRNHMINGEGGRIAEENRVDYVMDMTETMGTVWLGLTLNCCRCHDHKFDPLTQREYYQFTAFFNQTPVTGAGGNSQTAPSQTWSNPALDARLASATEEFNAATATLEQFETRTWPPGSRALKPLPGPVLAALAKKTASRSREDWTTLTTHLSKSHPEWARLQGDWMTKRDARDQANSAIPRVMVMENLKKARSTHVLDHGLYDQPRDEVKPGVPVALPPLTADGPPNRLALAQWLVRRDQPLTARVTVNRIWQMLFGVGLVKTAEDFGLQAEPPPHPELLDWLAAELMETGWDLKRLIRTIATSDAYRRSSVISSPLVYERDPENRFLARGARFRMPSWMIRDQALSVSGLLRPFKGGPGVNGYQPPGIWEEATFGNKKYTMGSGDDLHRRSLYTFWRRIVGPPLFFDSAKRQVCQVKPLRTNTPMHALTVLNDVTYVEAARAMAQRILQQEDTEATRFELAANLLWARSASPGETAVWQRSLHRAESLFLTDAAAAERLISQGESARDATLDARQHAAWTTLCLTLLNLDESLTKE